MGSVELLVLAVGLSMDAFAVAVCKGLAMRRVDWRAAFVLALFFGGFQALMPVVGWVAGSQFAQVIVPVGHWVAFALLAAIGAKMLWDALHGPTPDEASHEGAAGETARVAIDLREYLLLAVATSIDALAVGVTFSALSVDIAPAAAVIGCTTFALSLAGVALGNRFGAAYQRGAQAAGGAVLIAIGAKTLLEHLLG